MRWLFKALVLLWAAFFGYTGIMGLLDPTSYNATFGFPAMTGGALNTIRADLSAFFIVSAAAAIWGALGHGRAMLLYVPAALFGIAFVGRGIGGSMGDGFGPVVTSSMIAEAVSVLLLVVSARVLAKPA